LAAWFTAEDKTTSDKMTTDRQNVLTLLLECEIFGQMSTLVIAS